MPCFALQNLFGNTNLSLRELFPADCFSQVIAIAKTYSIPSDFNILNRSNPSSCCKKDKNLLVRML